MHGAEQVTFGGSGLDRGQALRARPEALRAAWAGGTVLPFWRGRPLVDAAGLPVWLETAHPFVAGAGERVFLGVDAGVPRFAAEVARGGDDGLPGAPVAGGPFDPTRQPHPALPGDLGFADLRGVLPGLDARSAELAAMARALLEWHGSHGFCAACGARTVLAHGGWQRHCPGCERSHFPRTDPVVIMLVTRGNRLLLGRSPGWPEAMYSLLAGFVEPGETVEAAVRREVAEETGVGVGAVSYLASQPWPFPASLMLGCRAEALDDRIVLDPEELEDALWITREEGVAVLAGHHPRIRPSREGSIARFIMMRWLADRLD